MKLFSSLHNPTTKKYALYYSIVLVIISISIIAINLQLIYLTFIEKTVMFGEGFFSLFMLTRHENTRKQLCNYISKSSTLFRGNLSIFTRL